MPQSLDNVLIHVIFSTRERMPFLSDSDLRRKTHAYMAGIIRKLGCAPIQIGGVADHVHLLVAISRTITIADFVKETKRATTDWLKNGDPEVPNFHWQRGYGVFSVSESARDEVTRYIASQEAHHRRTDYQSEFRKFCEKHGLEIDERYAWD
ncbi:MAG: IS200/IS605 family transposase [Verrucomicrobiae bacterium]|nr:IS200/IS605 family transposase [Verrucomicrobiae bacterium]